MAILDIIYFPNNLLREKSKPVLDIDDDIKKLAHNMTETMVKHNGVGLAAIQVGVPLRMFALDIHADKEELHPSPLIIINPEIIYHSSELSLYNEGCLSIPEMYEEVERPAHIKLRYQTLNNDSEEMHLEGLLSTCVQHEIDHLNGILFFDYLSRLKKNRFINKFYKKQNSKE